MPIIECKKTFRKKIIQGRLYNIPMWKCCCDYCGAEIEKFGEDPGQTSDNARKEGFKPVPVTLTSPMLWVCPSCIKQRGKA